MNHNMEQYRAYLDQLTHQIIFFLIKDFVFRSSVHTTTNESRNVEELIAAAVEEWNIIPQDTIN